MTSLPVTPAVLTQPGSVAVIAARGRMGAMLMHEGRLAGLGMAGFSRPFDWFDRLTNRKDCRGREGSRGQGAGDEDRS